MRYKNTGYGGAELTSAVQAPARVTGSSLPFLGD